MDGDHGPKAQENFSVTTGTLWSLALRLLREHLMAFSAQLPLLPPWWAGVLGTSVCPESARVHEVRHTRTLHSVLPVAATLSPEPPYLERGTAIGAGAQSS